MCFMRVIDSRNDGARSPKQYEATATAPYSAALRTAAIGS
jgi:hypothetical protein